MNRQPSITLLIKPASGSCNLSCRYCFYADEMNNRSEKTFGHMSLEDVYKRQEYERSSQGIKKNQAQYHAEPINWTHRPVQKPPVHKFPVLDRRIDDLCAPPKKGIKEKIPDQFVKRILHVLLLICLSPCAPVSDRRWGWYSSSV